MRRKILAWCLVVFGGVLGLLCCSLSASAYSYRLGADVLLDKIVLRNVKDCYSFLKDSLIWTQASHFLAHRGDSGASRGIFDNSLADLRMSMPNTVMDGTSSNSPALVCDEFLFGSYDGGSTWGSLINLRPYMLDDDYAVSISQETLEKVDTFLVKLGYERDSSGGSAAVPDSEKETVCLTVAIDWIIRNEAGTEWAANNLCFDLVKTGDGRIGVSGMAKERILEGYDKIPFDYTFDNTYFGVATIRPGYTMDNMPLDEYIVFPVVQNVDDGYNFNDILCYKELPSGVWSFQNADGEYNCSFASWNDFKDVFRRAEEHWTFDASRDGGYESSYTTAFLVVNSGRPDSIQTGIKIDDYPEPDFVVSGGDSTPVLTSSTTYKKTMQASAFATGLGFSSPGDFLSTHFSQAEVYDMYQRYIANGKYVNTYCGPRDDFEGMVDWTPVTLVHNGALERCYVSEKEVQKYTGCEGYPEYGESEYGQFGYSFIKKDMALSEILAQMNSMSDEMLEAIASDLNEYDYQYYDGGSSGSSGDDAGSTDPCYNNAESLGWFLCPVLRGVANALDGLYTNAVEPFLVVNPELVATNNGTYDAWKVMVTIANVMVLMFLLVVIFSQLTGVGIDNYGIKKALPKIILVAVLVNLSYVICQLAVDISNILGNGLNSLLSNIEVGGLDLISLSDGGTLGSVSGNAAWFKTMVLAVGGGLVAIGGVSLVSSIANGGWFAGLVLPILLFFVTALVAVLFFFILLGARKAGVVLLVVIAPLAFVMYMLPNTKKWFDKWLKMFEGLIMLYPLCGLLIGGGELASKILLSVSDDYIMYFTGLIAMVVPFFFIPTLLKGSFAAMGKLGAKISGFGAALGKRGRGKLSDTIKNSDAYKNRVQYNQDRAAIRRAQRTQKRLGRTQERLGSKGKELSARQQDRLRRAQDTLIAGGRREAENKRRGEGMYYEAALKAQEKQAEAAMISDYMNLVNNGTRNGEDNGKLEEMYDEYIKTNNRLGAIAVVRIAGRRKDTAAKFLKERIIDAGGVGRYDGKKDIFSSVVKEISTGENSVNYKESNPFGFEFAAQANRADGDYVKFDSWLSRDNMHTALNNYVTNSRDLVGLKSDALDTISDNMRLDGVMSAEDIARMRQLATETIANRDKGPWDSTKAEQLCKISGQYDYNRNTGEIIDKRKVGGGVATTASSGNSGGVAIEGQAYSVRDSGSADAAYIKAEAEQRVARIRAEAAQRASSIESISQNIGNESGMDYSSE